MEPRGRWLQRAVSVRVRGVTDEDAGGGAGSVSGIVLGIRCPGCGALPLMVISGHQAFCGDNDCKAIQFDMTQPTARFKATALVMELPADIESWMPDPEPEDPGPDTRSPQERYAEERAREIQIREYLHAQGYRCAEGCGRCGLDAAAREWIRTHLATWMPRVIAGAAGHRQVAAAIRARYGRLGLLEGQRQMWLEAERNSEAVDRLAALVRHLEQEEQRAAGG
jgi:hypothetical protein